MTSPVRLLPPCHIGVTGSHEGLPGGDNVLSALSPGEDQEVAWSTAHVMHQLLKCLLEQKGAEGPRAGALGLQRVSGPTPPTGWEGSVSSLPPASMPVEGPREERGGSPSTPREPTYKLKVGS